MPISPTKIRQVFNSSQSTQKVTIHRGFYPIKPKDLFLGNRITIIGSKQEQALETSMEQVDRFLPFNYLELLFSQIKDSGTIPFITREAILSDSTSKEQSPTLKYPIFYGVEKIVTQARASTFDGNKICDEYEASQLQIGENYKFLLINFIENLERRLNVLSSLRTNSTEIFWVSLKHHLGMATLSFSSDPLFYTERTGLTNPISFKS